MKGQLSIKRKKVKAQHTSPCVDCPFGRIALKGWLNGMSAGEWLALAHSDCDLHCHTKTAQCAGGAIFRSNVIKWAEFKLPQDKAKVFASDAEFAAHHLGRDVSQSEAAELKLRALLGERS